MQAHAARLGATVADIREGRVPRPRVLDPFAGGGSIPLEAARLGCDAYALELNPVAHLIEVVTLDYARRYGPELAEELEKWGKVVLRRAKDEIGDLYPAPAISTADTGTARQLRIGGGSDEVGAKALMPIGYLWTRTVRCKRPDCGGDVPLVRLTWLCRKAGRMVALQGEIDGKTKAIRYRVVEARSESDLGFDPEEGSSGGNATCLFCRTVADDEYVKAEGRAGRMGRALLAVICTKPGSDGKVYLSPQQAASAGGVDEQAIAERIDALVRETGLTPPDEPLPERGTLGFRVQAYGLTRWRDLFTCPLE